MCLDYRARSRFVREKEEVFDDESDDEGEDRENQLDTGRAWASLVAIKKVALLAVAVVCASALCFLYIIGTVLLWFVGIIGIFRICAREASNSKMVDGNIPKAMPGQEHGDHLKRAWELVNMRNCTSLENRDQMHFNVGSFLTGISGLNKEDLVRSAMPPPKESKSRTASST